MLYSIWDIASATSTLLRLILFFNKSDGRYVRILLIFDEIIDEILLLSSSMF